MRRVVPSEVVQFIDTVLPGAGRQAREKGDLAYSQPYIGQLSTLLALAEPVPKHLITLSDADYYVYPQRPHRSFFPGEDRKNEESAA